MPFDVTSAALTAIGIFVLYVFITVPKFFLIASTVLLARFVLLSTRVNKTPSTFKSGLVCALTLDTVCKSCVIALAGKYGACTGIITLSAAVKALSVNIPREGLQSIRI